MFCIQPGEYWLYQGEAFRVKSGVEIDDDGDVTIPIVWVSDPSLIEMHSTQAMAIAFAQGDLVRCEHDVVVPSECGGRRCAVCRHPLPGWYCPDSPTAEHECYYEDDEFCIHCGQPEERK